MMSGRLWVVGAWALGCSLVGAQGCILNGDASLGNDGETAGTGGDAGSASQAGSVGSPAGGKSGTGGKSGAGGKTVVPDPGEGGAALGHAGETGAGGEQGGEPSEACALPIEVGPCDAAIPRFAFDSQTGKCEAFVYGGCEGNANNFTTRAACQAACETLACPDHLQSDTVYEVLPLNRPERACVVLDEPILVSCSMLLDPSLTVPTNYGQDFCVKRNDTLFYAGTRLPKAEGWEDCAAGESEIVAGAPDCNDL